MSEEPFGKLLEAYHYCGDCRFYALQAAVTPKYPCYGDRQEVERLLQQGTGARSNALATLDLLAEVQLDVQSIKQACVTCAQTRLKNPEIDRVNPIQVSLAKIIPPKVISDSIELG